MLNGSLDTFSLPDVLRFVAGSNLTGRIEITRDEVGGDLSIDQGKFVAARLAEDEAPSTVDEALDVAVLLFDGSGGDFVVVQEDWVGGPLNLTAEQLTKAVEKRREEWAEVVSVLGSLEDPMILANDLAKGTETVTISAGQWGLLTLVDGERSAQDIARDAASSVYATARELAALFERGMVARGDRVRWEEAAAAPKKGKGASDDPAAVLHELAEDEDADVDADDDVEVEEEPVAKAVQPSRATVRPLRAPTREEQRIRLRR
jgi:hypothetical protein